MRIRFLKYLLISILLSCSCFAYAQIENDISEHLGINNSLYPPEDILSTKSLILLSVSKDAEVAEWTEMIDEFQLFFASVGIDAIGVLDVRDFFQSQNELSEIPPQLRNREVKNVIFLSLFNKEEPVIIGIGKFNGTEQVYSKGDYFWIRKASIDNVISEMEDLFKTGRFGRTNMLVNESPEFFFPQKDMGIIARSIPSKMLDFKTYVEPFQSSFYQEVGVQKMKFESFNAEAAYIQSFTEKNYQILSIAEDSSYHISLRPEDKSDQELRREGYQYALRYAFGKGPNIQKWFSNEEAIADEGYYYKFYIDDLRNNTNYIGKSWDASQDWSTALRSFLDQIKESLSN